MTLYSHVHLMESCLHHAENYQRCCTSRIETRCRPHLGKGRLLPCARRQGDQGRSRRHACVLRAGSSDPAAESSQHVRHKEAEMDAEIASIALPMLITLAADPLAGLVETAFIGRLGAVELAGMAVGLSIFSTITKFLNIPLISSTTTAVARATGAKKSSPPPPPQQQQEKQQQQQQQGSFQGEAAGSQGHGNKAAFVATGNTEQQQQQQQQQEILTPSRSGSSTATSSLPSHPSSSSPSLAQSTHAPASTNFSTTSNDNSKHRQEGGSASSSNSSSHSNGTGSEGAASRGAEPADPSSSSNNSSSSGGSSGSPFDPDTSVALPPGRHAIRTSLDVSGEQQQQQQQQQEGASQQEQGSQGSLKGVESGSTGEQPQQQQQSPVSVAASSAILLGAVIGLLEVLFVCLGAKGALGLWGVTSGASGDMYMPALDFLRVRAFGAPVQVLMLTLQGVFRGLQDARTPLQCSLASNFLNILLAPVLIFWAGWGVKGAAAAIVIAQALPTLYLLHALSKRVQLQLTSKETLVQLTKLAGPSVWLMIRSLGSTWTYAFATATVARAGAMHAAAHQVCFQLWMATTLTADAVAVAVQSLLARSIAQGDVPSSRRLVERCLTVGVGMGLIMALAVGTFRHALARIFTTDPFVLSLIASVMPMLVITQPINALAFVADGALFGVGGFKFASVSMAMAALPSLALIAYGSSQVDHAALVFVWLGLGLLMSVRAVSILAAYLLKRGPFRELSLPSDMGDRGNGKRGWVLSWGQSRLKLL